jgi:hypothetical protein
MPIAEEQATELFERFSRLIESSGLAWIVQEVRQKIAEGKYYEQALIESAQGTLPGITKLPVRVSSEFGTSVRYTERERVHLLLNALQQAIVQSLELQAAVTEKLRPEIHFAAEPVEDRKDFFVKRANVIEKHLQLEKFNFIVNRLRELLDE